MPAPPAIDGKVTLTILYPFDETLFPPEIAAPTFAWQSSPAGLAAWQIAFAFQDGKEDLVFSTSDTEWVPTDEDWGWIKERSVVKPATVRIRGFRDASSPEAACEARIRISTAADEVGAPLFFREVNVPFRVAVKDPAAHIRWRFGPVSSKGPPPIVMEKLPVCGNCHSFSADGRMLAMEVDSGNDKASYAIAPVEKKIVLEPENIITWADFRREDNQKTFGLLCQASPDGRHVVGTVKDRALAVYRDELAFSQLFFLVKGVMAIYDRQKDSIHLLPGADDPDHVQTNGTWSPDGKTIVFARSHDKAYDPPSLREIDSVLVPQAEAREFLDGGRTFCYDLYRIPFNEGKGGKAEPIPGASNNGMSNYFAKFSSDGKWIVFCKARSFMLLQPDSELYIIPAEGGEARRLRCNTGRMNSWHSWSPNGRWLVFSSKAFSDYTQLFLTHIDEEGNSTPAVQLKNFTVENRAANIPEFVNAAPDAIAEIREHFLDDTNYLRAGDEFQRQGEYQNAINRYHRAIDINPDNPLVYTNWGSCLLSLGRVEEAKERLLKAIELKPDLAIAHCNLGIVLLQQSQPAEAAAAHREAIRLDPDYAPARLHLGTLLLGQGQLEEAIVQLKEAARIAPYDPFGQFNLAMALIAARNPQPAAEHLELALAREPKFVPAMISLAVLRATSDDPALRRGQQAVELAERARSLVPPENPEVLHALAAAYAEVGRFEEAVATAQLAASTARNSGNAALAAAIEQALGMYSQRQPLRASF
ncbi:MAG: tetratricopeptide repeat protein [Planctomycetaceae bacterium]|nr:tetratricopeptide repeat protein [Planctomycetaceae bacterium]